MLKKLACVSLVLVVGSIGCAPDYEEVVASSSNDSKLTVAWDPCKSTIVTSDNTVMTAEDVCKMIQSSCPKGALVYESQCYPGVNACCASMGIPTSGGAGGKPDQRQRYGEYDDGAAGGIKPGSTTGGVHGAGAGRTTGSTPTSYGDQGKTQDKDACVISYAGQPNGADRAQADTIRGNNPSSTTCEGDGSRAGTKPANASSLGGALAGCGGKQCVLFITDHGNKGTNTVACSGDVCDGRISISQSLINDASSQGSAANSVLVFDARTAESLPHVVSVTFGSFVTSATLVPYSIAGTTRAHISLPNYALHTSNEVHIETSASDAHYSVWWDTGPVAKHSAASDATKSDATGVE